MVHHVTSVLAKEYSSVYAIAIDKERQNISNEDVHYLPSLGEHKRGLLGFYKTIKAIRKTILAINPDIVVSFVSDVAVCTRLATLGMRHLIVVSAERGDPFTLKPIWRKLVSWAYRHSDFCIFQLPNARDFFGKSILKKSFVIPNAAFLNTTKIGIHHVRKKTIVSIGRFVWEKGYEYLIEAFSNLKEKHPDYQLILYGAGPFLDQYKKQVETLGLNEDVIFPGYTYDIAEALKDEGIFVLPSRYEGIPNALIEALLVGIPTISCDCSPGGPRFLTNDGKHGSIVPVGNVKSLTDAMNQLIEDTALYQRYENLGPTIADALSPSKIEKLWLDAFEKISLDKY